MALTTQEAKPPPPEHLQTMADSTQVTENSAAGGEAAVHVWERPWTVEEMRKAADDWSLAGDAGMLQYLQDFSQRIVSRTHDIQEQVNGLVHESKLTGIRVQNAFNDFIMLANTQFVENRVYDEDINTETTDNADKREEKEKTREEREAELIPKMVQAMKLGFDVIDSAFEKLDVNEVNSDSDEEEESPYKTDTILEPKDPYLSRALPYLIGSQAFMTDDDVGLTDILSEEEESDHGSISESESESEEESTEKSAQEPHKTGRRPTISDSDSSESETESESESELFGTKDDDSDVSPASEEEDSPKSSGTSNFANELAAKLGTTEASDKPEKKEKKHSDVKKERTSSKHKPPHENEDDDLFGPPPMEDDDSPFGRKGGLFSSGGGLFDDDDENEGGLFDDVVAEKPKPPQNNPKPARKESVEEEQKPEEPASRPRTKSGRKVPVGGVSIFSGGDDGLFRSTKQDSESEEEEIVKQVTKPEKPPAAPTPAATNASLGLFDDDDDDLFSAIPPKKTAPKKESGTPVDLFGDDDDGDLFAAAPPPVKKQPEKEAAKPQKKLPVGAVSMFGSNSNPLAAAIKAQRPPSDKEDSDEDWEEDQASQSSSRSGTSSTLSDTRHMAPPGGMKKGASPSMSSNSLFAEEPEDDLLAAKPKPAAPAAAKPTSKSKPPALTPSSKGLFGEDSDEEDLFAVSAKPKSTKADTKPRATSLFLDDDEDDDEGALFAAAPKPKKHEPASKPKPTNSGGGMFDDDDLFAEPKVKPKEESKPQKVEAVAEPARPRKPTLSLFDEDEDSGDLFGSSPSPPKPKPPPASQPATLDTQGAKPRTRSLFADDDVLFGSTEEDPAVDLFGASSPLSPSKESKPFPPTSQKPKAEPTPDDMPEARLKDKVEVKGATISASSTDLFTGSGDETDLFSATPLPTTKPADKIDPKVEVKGATTSESSTDKAAKAAQGKKKPIGGVSMFGGMDPTSVLRKRAGTRESPPSDDDMKPTPPDFPVGSPDEDEGFLSSPKPPTQSLPTTMPKPTRPTPSSSIGKLQANLAINTSALLPGAAPADKTPAAVAAGFDEPVQASVLRTAQKDRVRGQSKRRPPTRKSRLVTSPPVGGDTADFAEPAFPSSASAADVTPPPAENHVTSPAMRTHPTLPFGDDEDEPDTSALFPASSARPEPARPAPAKKADDIEEDLFADADAVAPPVPKSTSNIFSEAFAKSKGYSRVKGPLENKDDGDSSLAKGETTKKAVVDITDDLFGTPVQKTPTSSSSVKPKHAKPVDLFDDEDDIFASAAAKPRASSIKTAPALNNDVDDIFADSSITAKKPSKPPVADDIFTTNSKAPPSDESDIFASSVSKPSKAKSKTPAAFEDDAEEDDLFGSVPATASKSKKQIKVAPSKSEPAQEDNIFADLPPAKSRDKKVKKKEEKSLFQDDIDDIFAEASVKPKTKKTATNKKKQSAASSDIFGNDDETSDIFDDPLNALMH